jgi:hypothetical protein
MTSDPTSQAENHGTAFTPEEMGLFKAYLAILVVIAVGMYFAAPRGVGQLMGVLFAFALVPVPPLVIHIVRRRRFSSDSERMTDPKSAPIASPLDGGRTNSDRDH